MDSSDYPTIISFYTKSWEYESHAERLTHECNSLGLDHYIKEYPDTGDWLSNTRIKATFIHEALNYLKRPVLWIDVDGSLYHKPDILKLPISYDFMGRHQRTGPMRTWHVGTMFFNFNESMVNFINLWKELAEKGNGTDEAAFDYIWKLHADNLKLTYKELPEEYFHISIGSSRNPSKSTVISHRLSKCETKIARKLSQQNRNDSKS